MKKELSVLREQLYDIGIKNNRYHSVDTRFQVQVIKEDHQESRESLHKR